MRDPEKNNEKLQPIRMLVLTLTGRCNFHCQYCYASEQDQTDMEDEVALAAVEMAGKSGERFLLQFSGGEPLLRFPLIRKVVNLVEKEHLNVQLQIQTNGSLLSEDIGKWLFEHKVGIGISCDGRPHVMDRTRQTKGGNSSSEEVTKGFRNLSKNGIGTGITCVVTDDMVEELDGIADMAYFYGNVHQIGFDILREQGRGMKLKAPDAKKLEEALKRTADKLDMLEKMTGQHIHFTQEDRVKRLAKTGKYEFPQCFAMNGEAAFIDVHGDIYACSSLMRREEYKLGTVRTGRDKKKVDEVSLFIKRMMQPCRECEYFSLCGGGCFSRWLDKNGKVQMSEAECALKKFFIKRYLKSQEKKVL